VVSARAYERSSVCHDGCRFVTHIHCQTSARELLSVHVQRKVIDVVMAEVLRVRIHAAQKIRVLYHSE
jgi:hypothetical protein